MKTTVPTILILAVMVLCLTQCSKSSIDITDTSYAANVKNLNPTQILGKKIFFDTRLSNPEGMSCASCHAQTNGFSDPLQRTFSEGAVAGSFVNRNAPTLSYLMYCPPFAYSNIDSTYIGGLFWDGRVNTFEEQGLKPLMNPLEMNNTSTRDIINKVANGSYAELFKNVYGAGIFDDSAAAINAVMKSIAAFERSSQLNSFSSKYDAYLLGAAKLTEQEQRGLDLFNDTEKANCVGCHPSDANNIYGAALFTDFSYDNIGLPHNPSSPTAAIDMGLGSILGNPNNNGQFRVPSLRNVAVSAPYFHNGYFSNLEDAIRFYSERDIPGKYAPPEYMPTMNRDELGDLKLTDDEIRDIAVFLTTLTDGYKAK